MVAPGFVDALLGDVDAELVRFVENDQIVGFNFRFRQGSEQVAGAQGVEGDDHPVALRPGERVSSASVRSLNNAALQAKQRPQLTFPIADQPGGRDNQHSADAAAGEHFANVEARHDGFARPGVIRK